MHRNSEDKEAHRRCTAQKVERLEAIPRKVHGDLHLWRRVPRFVRVALVRVEELRRCIARGDLGKTVILWWGRLLFIFQASLYFFILSLLVRFV